VRSAQRQRRGGSRGHAPRYPSNFLKKKIIRIKKYIYFSPLAPSQKIIGPSHKIMLALTQLWGYFVKMSFFSKVLVVWRVIMQALVVLEVIRRKCGSLED
jgi:hypothetical protein